tara:strand:- start:616 stop:1062 length:447 start_codon:yes stop_codon:yes gene_type:complete
VTPGTAKAKGRATENQAVDWLRENGYPYAERRRLVGSEDQGDVTGMPGICVEVKSAAAWKPVQWLRETRVEMENSRSAVGFVMARPKGGTNVNDWVIMMHPDTLLSLLTDAGWCVKPTSLCKIVSDAEENCTLARGHLSVCAFQTKIF